MNAETSDTPANAVSAEQLLKDWGWTDPPDAVIAVAELGCYVQQADPLEALAELRILPREEILAQLERCPPATSPLAWLRNNNPDIANDIEKILTLRSGQPYYRDLRIMEIHSAMQTEAVLARADAADAIIMMQEEVNPVIVFASHLALLQFRSMGREEKQKDALMSAAGASARLAVSTRDAVHSMLKIARGTDAENEDASGSTIWNTEDDKDNPDAREIIRLIDYALAQKATDISLFPLPNRGLRVLMRQNGSMLRPAVADFYKADIARRIVSLLMARSGANPSNTRVREPRDGQIAYHSNFMSAFLRLNFIPLNHLSDTEDQISVSIRLLPTTSALQSLTLLRMNDADAMQMRLALKHAQGLILVSGPTNSGKSTTIASALAEHVKMFGESKKRLSVEDPVERHVEGVIQINVPHHIRDEHKRFGIILPAIKRHDPDVVWIGEIRDTETANLCVAAANSGHLVFSTIHANDAVLAYDVLFNMIAPDLRFQLAESLLLSVSQRLVKRLCPACRIPHTPSAEDIALFNHYLEMLGEPGELPARVARANPEGCAACRQGYIGMLPINETLPFTRKVKAACAQATQGNAVIRDILSNSRATTLLQGLLQRVANLEVEADSLFS